MENRINWLLAFTHPKFSTHHNGDIQERMSHWSCIIDRNNKNTCFRGTWKSNRQWNGTKFPHVMSMVTMMWWRVVLDTLEAYNLGYGLEFEICSYFQWLHMFWCFSMLSNKTRFDMNKLRGNSKNIVGKYSRLVYHFVRSIASWSHKH